MAEFKITEIYEDWRKPGTPYCFHASKGSALRYFRYHTREDAEENRKRIEDLNS